ncbi:ATP-binding protein [Phenylobacterium sp. LjRoot219]|uniref:ATP-binding protein n=1 Tax=Phenylobacterium sp. LjRoot219 TaxID=3342283 RepID=UPI003ECD2EEC
MTLLFDIAPYAEPVTADVAGREIYKRFQDEPDTLAIAVVDAAGGPIGLIERNDFLVRMAGQYGYALWSGRPVSFWMRTDPVVADGEMTVAEFCGRVLEERPSELLQGFIVTCGGRYAGVGTALDLLQATATATATATYARETQAALAAKERFLAVMSHEIRTPLNGVLGVAEIVRRKSRQPDLAPFVDTILDSGRTLLRLLNDALDLSRAEASGLDLKEGPLEAATLLEDVSSLWSAQAELKGLSFRAVYAGPQDLWLLADRDRLRQVLNNLVGNALKFTERGGVEVRLSAVVEGDCVRLSACVDDTGPGVPAARREEIFAPFSQTEVGMQLGGAGLGLAVCRQIVERMNGLIRAEESPAGGARFVFEAPLYHVPAPAAQAAQPTPAEAQGGALHVLIVDDNATNRLVAATLCEMFGCSSEAVEGGLAAVQAAASGRFDLVLMDIKMPGVDGIEATRRIRSGAGVWSQLPIIAVTANADPSDAAFYRASGMNGVVEKPLKPERLLAAMGAVLELADAEAAVCAA